MPKTQSRNRKKTKGLTIRLPAAKIVSTPQASSSNAQASESASGNDATQDMANSHSSQTPVTPSTPNLTPPDAEMDVDGMQSFSDDEVDGSDLGQTIDVLQSQRARSPRWQPWQDRYLIEEVYNLRPFEASRGSASSHAWQTLSRQLFDKTTRIGPHSIVDRSGEACRSRFRVLMKAQRVCV